MAKMKADTILKKIQKGTNKVRDGFNSVFNFNVGNRVRHFRKREIVKPYLHSIDSRMISSEVKNHIKSNVSDPNYVENIDKFMPEHLVGDLYSLYYNQSDRLHFEGLNSTNKIKFDIIDSINNSLIKIVTNNSHIASFVYTEEIAAFLYKKFLQLPPEMQQQMQQQLQRCNQGDGDGDEDGEGSFDDKEQGYGRQDSTGNEEADNEVRDSRTGAANNSQGNNSQTDYSQQAVDKMLEALKKMLNSTQAKQELEQSFKKAEQKLEKLREIGINFDNDGHVDEVTQKEIISNLNNLDHLKHELMNLNTSKEKVLKAVEKILSNTNNYFSKRCITNDVELFEAEEILDINGLEFLHPAFKKSRLFDLSITERKYVGKFDLYVDCSGSMSSGCGGELSNVSRIVLAKSLAMQMKNLGILGDLYEYEDKVKKVHNSDISILMMNARGGTNIDNVIKKILETGKNSVVLTDGESSVFNYSERILFIGVGTNFGYFRNDKNVGNKFLDNDQCIMYNGKEFVTTGITL